MNKAKKINKLKNLKVEEISRREVVEKAVWEQRGTEKVDIKSTFEYIYLNFIPLLADRRLVEDDLKELKSMIDACADRMIAIREKSKGKTQSGVRSASAYPRKYTTRQRKGKESQRF